MEYPQFILEAANDYDIDPMMVQLIWNECQEMVQFHDKLKKYVEQRSQSDDL